MDPECGVRVAVDSAHVNAAFRVHSRLKRS